MIVPSSTSSDKRTPPNRRLGFHYFPDTLHYREADLQTWLPQLGSLGAGWLVVRSATNRAIPEHFLRGLKSAGIEPLIQFNLPLDSRSDPRDLARDVEPLLEVYARWGARNVIFFDRPNARASWSASGWVQQDLVERFLDRFLPLADLALRAGLNPLFPPLEPGGSYWDTAFLRSALQALQRRKQESLLRNLILCAYAWGNGRSLDWGGGGPERWPEARAYHTPEGSQDQRGFRIYEWYLAITRSVLEREVPVILLQTALPGDPHTLTGQPVPASTHTTDCLSVARMLAGEAVVDPLDENNLLDPISPQVMACNFWLLSTAPGDPCEGQAWFPMQADQAVQRVRPAETPAARALRGWLHDRPTVPLPREVEQANEVPQTGGLRPAPAIRHYLLLPGYEWGVSDWYLEIIRPFVKKYRPTVGFSVDEAARSAQVTVVGNDQNYPDDLLIRLRSAGCAVEQINGDGARIATLLAER